MMITMLGFLVVISVVIGYLMITCFTVAALQEFVKWNDPSLEWSYGLLWPITGLMFVTYVVSFAAWKYALAPVTGFFGRYMTKFVDFLTRPRVKLPKMEVRK